MKWLGPYICEGIVDDDLWQTVCAVDTGSPGYIYVRGWRDCVEDDCSTLNVNQGCVCVAHMRLLPDGVVWWKETPDKVTASWENATKSMDQNDLNSIECHDPDDTRRLYVNAQIRLCASGQITLCCGPSNWADIDNGGAAHLVGVLAVTNSGNDGFWGATGEPHFWKGDGEFLPRCWPANMCQDCWLDRSAPNSK